MAKFTYKLAMLSLVSGIAATAAQAANANAANMVSYHVPATDMAQALTDFGRQSGLAILFDPQVVRGKQASAVRGMMPADQAISLLLQGSGLRAKPAGKGAYVISVAGAASQTSTGMAGTLQPQLERATAASLVDEPIDDIIVTGTRSIGRKALDAAVPVTVISSRALAETGSVNLAAQLQNLEPSINYPRATTGASAAGNRVVTLRGLSPDQTLVLVNGKRRHAASFLNINTAAGRGAASIDLSVIPDAAVERVEVLKDGAAAQYGSDAIAGVINIILAGKAPGLTGSFTTGLTQEGDGEVIKGDLRYGILLGDGGHATFTLEGRVTGETSRVNVDSRVGYETGKIGDPRQTALLGAIDLALPIGTGELYVSATAGARDVRQQTFLFLPPVVPAPLYPTVRIKVKDWEATAGYRTPVGDLLTLDVSDTFGFNMASFRDDTVNPSLVGRPGGSPTSFFGGRTRYLQNIVDLMVSTSQAFSRNYHISVGAQHRSENFNVKPAEADAIFGAGPLLGVLFSNAVVYERNAYAAFVDLEASPLSKLNLGFAARYDHFSDFGGATTWKASARYELTDWLALRGSASTGFRAPSVQQNSYSTITAVQSSGTLTATAVLPVSSPIAQALGATSLRPEKSKNLGAGLVVTPARGLSFTADWYRILIDDRITLSDVLGGANAGGFVSGVLNANGVTNYQRAQFFGNFIDTRTSGIEFSARYAFSLGERDHVRTSLNYATFNQKIRNIRTSATPGGPQYIIVGPNTVPTLFYVIAGTQPEDKVTFSGAWDHRPFSLNVNIVRYGGFTYATGGAIQRFFPKILGDVSASYAPNTNLSLTMGVQNVGNVYPTPYLRTPFAVSNAGGTIKYPEDSPFGFNGRSFYLRAAFTF